MSNPAHGLAVTGGRAIKESVAAFVVGATTGAGTAAGSALLLYTGQGFLATAGFLLAVSVAALAAGVWVGAPDHHPLPATARRRWFWVVLAFNAAGIFAIFWTARESLRSTGLGGALAVLLILAEPAYASGTLVSTLDSRARAIRAGDGIGVPVMIGAAVGILVATTLLIPNFDAPGVFFGAAALLAITGGIESARTARAATTEDALMNDSVAIITGVGERGQVGFAIARRFLDAGWRVVITGFSSRVHELTAELSRHGPVVAVQADLTVPDEVTTVLEAANDRFGRIDAVINAAGGLTVIKPLVDTDTEEWRREHQRNAETTYQVCRAVLPTLRQRGGAIVNFAAPAGERAAKNLAAYSAAKAAVIALTRAIALEERINGVRANAIAPGLVDTEQNRRAFEDKEHTRFVTREEIAEVALFLATPAASGISGETIEVMGDALG